MFTSSNSVCPSTSKSPFASIAPVKVEIPATLTLLAYNCHVLSDWPKLLAPELLGIKSEWTLDTIVTASLIALPIVTSPFNDAKPLKVASAPNVDTPVTDNVPVVVPPETNTPSFVVRIFSALS